MANSRLKHLTERQVSEIVRASQAYSNVSRPHSYDIHRSSETHPEVFREASETFGKLALKEGASELDIDELGDEPEEWHVLIRLIGSLSPDSLRELTALMWLGSDAELFKSYSAALEHARVGTVIEHIAAKPLWDYLPRGLKRLNAE